MSKFSEMLAVMTDEIHKYSRKCIESASFDRTEQGIITASLGNNKYYVKIKGTVFTVPSSTSYTYYVNDNVLILYVQNDPNKKYITGKAVN